MCRSCKILVHRGLDNKVWSSRHGILLPSNGGWNYFGAEKMQQVIGLMRGQEQTADKSQKKNRQNSVEL